MREIKFRAWDKIKKLWTNWKSYDGMFYFMDKNTGVWIRDDKFERFILLQYTGLKDKNGKEIYEGDIVCDRWANFYTPIFRNGIYMAYNVKDLHLTKQEPSTQFNVIWKNGCEVIGNIHDNPELLEV